MYTIFNVKTVYIGVISLFELGSLVCATAPNSVALIIGRAIAGIGAAGIYSGSVVILAHSAPLSRRPLLTGLLGASLGLASIVGPFLGGAFTLVPSSLRTVDSVDISNKLVRDHVTWRWCFFINLPLGAITIGVVIMFVKIPRDPRYAPLGTFALLKQLDIAGTATLMPSIICLLLALQWGGSTYAWANARIIVLFILFAVLLNCFIVIQCYTPKTRTLSRSIFQSRSIGFATWYGGCIFSAFMIMVYYLPIWFQGVQQVSAFESGIRNIPLVLGFIVFAILSGALTNTLGYYTPLMILASIMTSTGAGLLSTLKPTSGKEKWIGYQVLFGSGIGFGVQHPLLVVQTVLPEKDVPVGVTLITLIQSLFGAIFVSVAQNVFQNELRIDTDAVLPGFDTSLLITAGATKISSVVKPQDLLLVISAYSKALTQTFYITIAVASLSIIGALGTEWISVKKEKKTENEDKKEETEKVA